MAKSGNHIPSCHQSRHRGPLSDHPRQRSSSLSHVQGRKSCLLDQDIRTAMVNWKQPDSSPDENSTSREKIQKPGVT